MELTTTRPIPEPSFEAPSGDDLPPVIDPRDEVIAKLEEAWVYALQEVFAEPEAA